MDKKEALKLIKAGIFSLANADKKLKADKEVVLASVKQDGFALQDADKKLKKDKKIVLAAVKQDGRSLKYADKKLKADKDVVLAAVKKSGDALEYADDSLKNDPDILPQTSDKKRVVRQIAKGLKEAFDENEDIALDYDIPSKENFELVITRDSEGEDGQYNITLDLHEDESDDYEQIAYSGGGSELSDFEGIIQAFIENGGRIEDLYTYIVKEK